MADQTPADGVAAPTAAAAAPAAPVASAPVASVNPPAAPVTAAPVAKLSPAVGAASASEGQSNRIEDGDTRAPTRQFNNFKAPGVAERRLQKFSQMLMEVVLKPNGFQPKSNDEDKFVFNAGGLTIIIKDGTRLDPKLTLSILKTVGQTTEKIGGDVETFEYSNVSGAERAVKAMLERQRALILPEGKEFTWGEPGSAEQAE